MSGCVFLISTRFMDPFSNALYLMAIGSQKNTSLPLWRLGCPCAVDRYGGNICTATFHSIDIISNKYKREILCPYTSRR